METHLTLHTSSKRGKCYSPSFGALTEVNVNTEKLIVSGGSVTVCDADTTRVSRSSRILNYVNARFPSGMYEYKVYITAYKASDRNITSMVPVHFNYDTSLPSNNVIGGSNNTQYKRIEARNHFDGTTLNGTYTADLSDCTMVLASEKDVNGAQHPRISHIKVIYDLPETKTWESY